MWRMNTVPTIVVGRHIKPESVLSNNLLLSAMASGSGESLFDQYNLSSFDTENLMPNNVANTTPGRSDCASRSSPAARLYLNSPPSSLKNWGQVDPDLRDYHSNPMGISSTFWIPDITDWWRQQEELHSRYVDHSTVARDIFSIIQHGVGVEASFSLGWDVIVCRQSKIPGENLRETDIVRQVALAINGISAVDDPALDMKPQKTTRKWRQSQRTQHCTE